LKAYSDIAGLYVWLCHILEHADNEMMRSKVVCPAAEQGVAAVRRSFPGFFGPSPEHMHAKHCTLPAFFVVVHK